MVKVVIVTNCAWFDAFDSVNSAQHQLILYCQIFMSNLFGLICDRTIESAPQIGTCLDFMAMSHILANLIGGYYFEQPNLGKVRAKKLKN